MASTDPPENDLLAPVLRLFPKAAYDRFTEVPLGRKKIDLVCLPRQDGPPSVCVELKVRNWRRALWQAMANFQVAEKSYIAIWHKYLLPAKEGSRLLEHYGVGLICVAGRRAQIIAPSNDKITRIRREDKRGFYRAILDRV